MPVELLLPRVKVPVLPMPSYVKLAMAFGVGAGATLYDKSRYRSHGAITGAAWAAGLHGYCLDFDPTLPSYVVIPAAHTELDFTTEDFSLVMRLKVDAIADTLALFTRGLFNVDGYQLQIVDTLDRLGFYTWQTPANQISSTANGSIVIDTWYTIGVSRSGASARIYIDGVDATTGVGVHIDPLTNARSAKIGTRDDTFSDHFDGKIEFFRIFGVALQLSEHLAWHNALA